MAEVDAGKLALAFVRHFVIAAKRKRYAGFVATPKNRRKFLEALDHRLPFELEASTRLAAAPAAHWKVPALFYASNGAFGEAFDSMEAAYVQAPSDGGWLIVGADGNAAIFRPEGREDDEMYLLHPAPARR